MYIKRMTMEHYDRAYQLWTNTAGMGMRSLDDSYEGIEKFLKRNPTTCFVAMAEQELVGIILCGHDGRRGYIYHAAVLPDYRGKGIGRSLVEEVLSALSAEGINKVALVVFASNENGNDFWKRLGFKQREDLIYRDFNLNEDNR